jgi:hypothetical protein
MTEPCAPLDVALWADAFRLALQPYADSTSLRDKASVDRLIC